MTTVTFPPVLVIGARSDIGRAVAHRFAAAGHAVILAARRASELEQDRADISLRHGVEATLVEFDVLDTGGMADFVAQISPEPQIVVSVVGAMGDQAESESSPAAAALIMRTNYEGPALILGLFAERMAKAGTGTIVGVSSVAGDRGRASNYIYGSAKAGFTAFLSGLRNRLADKGVHVLTVKPGFVRTKMTEGMDLPKRLTAAPEEVADAIYAAVGKRHNAIYVRPIWALVMAVIRSIPEPIFKKTQL
ncbi:SDR family oxidoreductase [Alloyangia pacifica]|uniref:Short-chain dehydrogenase n=1 Tax=Alloyangia pacifica TaxID=311180 RepID=A0A1I6WEE5_9RHOB|nr:SDR family oxidoreductase [Alloyangia pacifica]SDI62713.1 hypothetical protein SAMN04488245_12031 [Alloyangia pacifica]SFT24367.1 hypothetical protein SAMN04488050_11932 [Alloyangia pacifica]